MRFDPQKHHRRSIRLKEYDYSQPGAYFITICTHKWTLLFGDVLNGELRLNGLGKVAHKEWARLPKRFPFLEFGPFVVMPNHIHGLLIISADDNLRRGTAWDAGIPNPGNIHRDQENPFVENIRRAQNDNHSKPISGYGDDGEGTALDEKNRHAETSRRAPTDDGDRTEAFGRPVPGSIPTIVRSYKSSVAWHINRMPGRLDHPVWQRNYYEHVVRNAKAMEMIVAYIADNPRLWDEDRIHPKFYRE